MIRLAVALLLIAACGSSKPAAEKPADFGKACSVDADCATGLCFAFGSGAKLCTVKCSSSNECPSGSEGQKCNGKGTCKP